MALTADETIFPNNIVKAISLAMKRIDEDVRVFKRPLRNTDPNQSVGISAAGWTPDPSSLEMQALGMPASQLPTIQEYTFNLQAFVKDTEEERGLALHAAMSQRVRSVLYTDPDLQVILSKLSVNLDGGWVEGMRRWGIRGARYFSGEISAQMLYLSTLEFWIETETRRNQ